MAHVVDDQRAGFVAAGQSRRDGVRSTLSTVNTTTSIRRFERRCGSPRSALPGLLAVDLATHHLCREASRQERSGLKIRDGYRHLLASGEEILRKICGAGNAQQARLLPKPQIRGPAGGAPG